MKNNSIRRTLWRVLPAASPVLAGAWACTLSGTASAQVKPTITFDLRVHETGAKEVTLTRTGDSVILDLYAVVQGLDLNYANDSIGSAQGTVISTGYLLGNLLGLRPPPPFDGSGIDVGSQVDLDGDGDLDIGPRTDYPGGGWYYFRCPPPLPLPQPQDGFFVGQMKFTIGQVDSTERQASVNWVQKMTSTGLVAMADGVGAGLSGFNVVTSPVVVRGVALPDGGNVQYLSGTIPNHLSISNNVRPTPGGGGIHFATGLDVTATGTLDNASGAISIHVNDGTSGNFGGAIYANTLLIGTTANGSFTQAGGSTRVSFDIGLATASPAKTAALHVTGGTIEAPGLKVGGEGVGTYSQSGGTAKLGALTLGSSGGAGSSAAVSDGLLEVTGNVTIGDHSVGTFTQAGGMTKFGGNVDVGFWGNGAIRVEGGTLNAGLTRIGVYSAPGAGHVTQTGGTFDTTTLAVGGISSATPATMELSAGVVRSNTIALMANGIFTQSGGSVVTVVNDHRGNVQVVPQHPTHVAQYAISGGSITTSALRVRHTNLSPVAGTGRIGGFVQTGGVVATRSLNIEFGGTYEAVAGTIDVTERVTLRGTMDFTGGVAQLNLGNNAFADFTKGRLLNAHNATFTGGTGSLMSFPAGFDPVAQIGTIDTDGLVHVAGQPLEIPQGESVGGSGTIEGDVTNDGTVAPGNSPGAIVVNGNYTQTAGARLAMEIGGLLAGEEFDTLSISGAAALDGLLEVSLLDSYVPAASDRFTLITAGSLSGGFDNVIGGRIEFASGRFDVGYTPTSVTLSNFQAVPEPGSVMVLTLAVGAASMRRRRYFGGRVVRC